MSTTIERSRSAFERWLAFLEKDCTWEKGSLDESSWKALLRAGTLGVEEATALSEVTTRIAGAGGHPRGGKLRQQAMRAYAYAGAHSAAPDEPLPAPKPPLVFDPRTLERLAGRLAQPPDWAQTLSAISPLPPAEQSPASVLRALYRPGERVLIFTGDPRSQGDYLFRVPAPQESLQEIPKQYIAHSEGAWILVQPVSGEMCQNPRSGNFSRRSEEAIVSWRYLVLESDIAPWRSWLSIIVQLPLPVAAIYTSGGRSIHALVVVSADSKSAWDHIVRGELMPLLVPLGADSQALTAVRLSRLPGGWRGGRRQRLLYLNPTPTDKPLCQARGWRETFRVLTP